MSDILKMKFDEEDKDDDDKRYRNRPALYPKLEEALIYL